ncbi:hypothetical protein DFH11DRAFT_1075853 [Phellopilus nigrolimitatus]|nr:hypothetical protein DFH11DRAFT_1075853 [Phellopilus nigrolimitatus]
MRFLYFTTMQVQSQDRLERGCAYIVFTGDRAQISNGMGMLLTYRDRDAGFFFECRPVPEDWSDRNIAQYWSGPVRRAVDEIDVSVLRANPYVRLHSTFKINTAPLTTRLFHAISDSMSSMSNSDFAEPYTWFAKCLGFVDARIGAMAEEAGGYGNRAAPGTVF